MSPYGALTSAIIALLALAGLAAWLLNVPVLATLVLIAAGTWIARLALRRFSRARDRQDTEELR
jgi:threonine/homoserine/homoserine lactone efflux protein